MKCPESATSSTVSRPAARAAEGLEQGAVPEREVVHAEEEVRGHRSAPSRRSGLSAASAPRVGGSPGRSARRRVRAPARAALPRRPPRRRSPNASARTLSERSSRATAGEWRSTVSPSPGVASTTWYQSRHNRSACRARGRAGGHGGQDVQREVATQALGCPQRDQEADPATPVVGDEVGGLDLQGVEDREHVVGKRLLLIARARRIAPAEATQVREHAAPAAGELGEHLAPLEPVLGPAVQQHQRRGVRRAGERNVEAQATRRDDCVLDLYPGICGNGRVGAMFAGGACPAAASLGRRVAISDLELPAARGDQLGVLQRGRAVNVDLCVVLARDHRDERRGRRVLHDEDRVPPRPRALADHERPRGARVERALAPTASRWGPTSRA